MTGTNENQTIETEQAPTSEFSGIAKEIFDAVEYVLEKTDVGPISTEALSQNLVASICAAMGGRVVYIPFLSRESRRSRDSEVYESWKVGGISHSQLARKYKMSVASVYRILGSQGQTDMLNKVREARRSRNTEIYECWKVGDVSTAQLATKYNLSKSVIIGIIKLHFQADAPGKPFPRRNPYYLRDCEIYKSWKAGGTSHSQLASKYNISVTRVLRIINKQRLTNTKKIQSTGI